jgi:fatty-acyl-CoA synthase
MPNRTPLDCADIIAGTRAHAIGDLLRRTARRAPDKLALVSGEVRWTYAEFDGVVNRTANAISDRGIGKGDRVALLSHNGWEFCVLAFALARLGAVLVPVNFMLTDREVAFILEHAGVVGMITEDALHPVAASALALAALEPRLKGWIALDGHPAADGWEPVDDWTRHEDASEPGTQIADDDPLRFMYTSGTEARPKGVMLSSRSLIAQYVSCVIDGEMTQDDIEVHSMPMYHCAQLDCFLGPDVYVGATNIVLPSPDPEALLATIQRERATKLFCPPTVWISILRSPEFDRTDLSSLRKGYYGASPMPVEILREIQDRLPDVRLWNFYGQTEMSPLATILKPHEQLSHAGSAGRAAINVETKLVDDDGNDVPVGAVGEIVHRSPHAMLGYYNDEAKTAEAFRGGWFHSGDLGVMTADGHLSVVDRKKDMIKTGGENVASREVEEAIYTLDGVAEVAVFGVPDPRWVEVVVAAVVTKGGAELTADAVRAHCRETLAGFKAPKHVVLVDELPKNPSGKILKRDLRDTHAQVASAQGGDAQGGAA